MERHFQFTDRMKRIINFAKELALKSEDKVLLPAHLLLGCLQEKTGVLGEVTMQLDGYTLAEITERLYTHQKSHAPTKHDAVNIALTVEAKIALEKATDYMKHYNQIYLNEGHLIKVLLSLENIQSALPETLKLSLHHATKARDMISYLGDYKLPSLQFQSIRKASSVDKNNLVAFVKNHFSAEWANTIQKAFVMDSPTIYVAFDENQQLIGFAGFDINNGKKNHLGPMGVAKHNRIKGVGYALLHHCLHDMKKTGYDYAIIGGAGPMEFYEKACGAVLIPQG